jgi:hypothetical protein
VSDDYRCDFKGCWICYPKDDELRVPPSITFYEGPLDGQKVTFATKEPPERFEPLGNTAVYELDESGPVYVYAGQR